MSAAVDVKDDDIDNGDLIHMGGDLVDMMSLVSILRKNVNTVKRINLYDNQIKRLKPVCYHILPLYFIPNSLQHTHTHIHIHVGGDNT